MMVCSALRFAPLRPLRTLLGSNRMSRGVGRTTAFGVVSVPPLQVVGTQKCQVKNSRTMVCVTRPRLGPVARQQARRGHAVANTEADEYRPDVEFDGVQRNEQSRADLLV